MYVAQPLSQVRLCSLTLLSTNKVLILNCRIHTACPSLDTPFEFGKITIFTVVKIMIDPSPYWANNQCVHFQTNGHK